MPVVNILRDYFKPNVCASMSTFWSTGGGSAPSSVCLSAQYQQEIAVLQEKLRASVQKLEEYEARLKGQDEQAQKVLMEYQARLEESEERLRRQQDDKDLQMKGIISR